MVKRIGGFRRKTRDKFKKYFRQKGKIGLSKYFQQFKSGEKVILKAESSVHEGLYHPRYHGLHGIVGDKQGQCYKVEICDQGKKKSLVVHPVHLKRI